MKNNSISAISGAISEKIFHPLKVWVEESNDHWNMMIVGGLVLMIVGGILLWVYSRKIGKTDERTSPIYLKCTYIMFTVVVLLDCIFPKEYMWQLFFLFKYSLAFIAGGIYLAIRYKKEFLN